MDTLILSCGTGGGHNAAGRAMEAELTRRGHRVTMMNPYELQSEQLARAVDQAYIKLAQKAPQGFGAVYWIGNLYRQLPFRSPVYFANQGMEEKMAAYLREHHFDVVLMPHLFPAEIFTSMKNHGMTVPKNMLIATDYTCIPFMEETDCDAYVVPAPDLTQDFIDRGIDAKRIYPLGIPVHPDFETNLSRRAAMEELMLDPSKRYILMSGGSMGAGSMERVLTAMMDWAKPNPKIQFIVVCGSNEALYQRLLKRYATKGVRVIGYTGRMHLYMKASALYVTKPGGLSSTEAAVMGVPILHVSPIPGCETINAHYFESRHMSLALMRPDREQVSFAMQTLGQREVRRKMVERQHRCIPAGAAGRIADLAERLRFQ